MRDSWKNFWGFGGNILGISWAYLWVILGIPWAYLKHILGLSWAYLEHILGISWGYDRESGGYLGDILHAQSLSAKGTKPERKKKQALNHPPHFDSQISVFLSFLYVQIFPYSHVDRLFQMDALMHPPRLS